MILKAVEDVLDAAIDYEAAYGAWWSSYCTRDVNTGERPLDHGELIIERAKAHKALLDAVRTMNQQAKVARLGAEVVERDKELLDHLAEGPSSE